MRRDVLLFFGGIAAATLVQFATHWDWRGLPANELRAEEMAYDRGDDRYAERDDARRERPGAAWRDDSRRRDRDADRDDADQGPQTRRDRPGERGMGEFAERDERARGEREHRERGPREHAERGRRGGDADRDMRHEEAGPRHRGDGHRGNRDREEWADRGHERGEHQAHRGERGEWRGHRDGFAWAGHHRHQHRHHHHGFGRDGRHGGGR